MSKKVRGMGFVLLLAFALTVLAPVVVQAQLVTDNLKVKIVKVDRPSSRLEVRVHESSNPNIQYVLIDENTKFSAKNKELTQEQAWKKLKPDMIVRVKGGLTMGLKVRAKYIYW